MTLVVPFDNSTLSKTALVRATQFDEVLDEGVRVVTVIPKNNTDYARKQGWLNSDEEFDGDLIVSRLRESVKEINESAQFEYVAAGRYVQTGAIASKIRSFARKSDASIVFIGSENAGRVTRTVSSVGGTVATDDHYDTMLISHATPAKIEEFEETIPTESVIN